MKIAHLGFVVKDIDLALESWVSSGYSVKIPKTFDPIQNVFCLVLAKDDEVDIELVSPGLSDKNPLTSRLKKGGGLDHICFQTKDIELSLELERLNHSIIVCQPVLAETFQQRIAFVVRSGGILVEFIEETASNDGH
jgi:methylmalonyl-CoA/ethylmalonyl-CoA epimerase